MVRSDFQSTGPGGRNARAAARYAAQWFGKICAQPSEYAMNNPEPTRLRAAENAFEVAIRAAGQALVDASAAAHEIDAIDPPKNDQDADYDRMLWLGKITDGVGVLCTPRLRVLAAILDEVIALEEPGELSDKRHTAH
jgi:hypothetical protein